MFYHLVSGSMAIATPMGLSWPLINRHLFGVAPAAIYFHYGVICGYTWIFLLCVKIGRCFFCDGYPCNSRNLDIYQGFLRPNLCRNSPKKPTNFGRHFDISRRSRYIHLGGAWQLKHFLFSPRIVEDEPMLTCAYFSDRLVKNHIFLCTYTRWWFQTFFIFTPIWGRFPI